MTTDNQTFQEGSSLIDASGFGKPALHVERRSAVEEVVLAAEFFSTLRNRLQTELPPPQSLKLPEPLKQSLRDAIQNQKVETRQPDASDDDE